MCSSGDMLADRDRDRHTCPSQCSAYQPTIVNARLRATYAAQHKHQLSQMDPRDELPHAHRAVHRWRQCAPPHLIHGSFDPHEACTANDILIGLAVTVQLSPNTHRHTDRRATCSNSRISAMHAMQPNNARVN